jgi:3-methylcrotonyl-CoA carboxylase alpha subunit
MIAKLVVHGPNRAAALGGLKTALEATEVAGSIVNTAFLAALASDEDFAAGNVDTGMIGRKQAALTTVRSPGGETIAAAVLAAAGADAAPMSADPWSTLAGYAHFHAAAKRVRLSIGDHQIEAMIAAGQRGFEVRLEKTEVGAAPHPPAGIPSPHDDRERRAAATPSRIARWPGHVTVFEGAVGYDFAVFDPFAAAAEATAGASSMRAPMPGLVKIVRAATGDTVRKGQPLLVLEAMKMEHTIAASHDGVVAEIALEGSQISEGTVLVRFEE